MGRLFNGFKKLIKRCRIFYWCRITHTGWFSTIHDVDDFWIVPCPVIKLFLLSGDLGKAKSKPKFKHLFSKSRAINLLSAARLFLFGARDIWFVVALRVYFQTSLDWSNTQVGSFMALWIIAYGLIQSIAPMITHQNKKTAPDGKTALFWVILLAAVPGLIAWQLLAPIYNNEIVLVVELIIFGVIFAINSSVYSFLILAYSRKDGVSLDVGFCYMANASRRLVGTILSGVIFQWRGLEACLLIASVFLIISTIISMALPEHNHKPPA